MFGNADVADLSERIMPSLTKQFINFSPNFFKKSVVSKNSLQNRIFSCSEHFARSILLGVSCLESLAWSYKKNVAHILHVDDTVVLITPEFTFTRFTAQSSAT